MPVEPARVVASVSSERSRSDIRLFQPMKDARVPGRKDGRLALPMGTWDPRRRDRSFPLVPERERSLIGLGRLRGQIEAPMYLFNRQIRFRPCKTRDQMD